MVELAVLEFRSIVEILCLSFHFHHHYQQFKKEEHLSTKAVNILLTHLPLILLSLLSLVLYSSTSCKSTKESCHNVTQQVGLVKIPLGILTTSPFTFCYESINEPTILPIILSSLMMASLPICQLSTCFFCFLSFSFSVNHLSPIYLADKVLFLIRFQC